MAGEIGTVSERFRAPLAERLAAYAAGRPCRLHIPGHKGRGGTTKDGDPAGGPWSAWFVWDVTEIEGLDNLHEPEGVIAEAQRLAAACFGAEEAFFLVGGATAGNLATILALCDPGDLLVVQRDAHQSVLHGLQLAGARAVFVSPQVCPCSGLPAGVRPEDVRSALERYPEAKAVLLTDPNYYGAGSDMRALAEIAHAVDKPLVVDAAHGAHYGFHPGLPPSALACGADAAVLSAHKSLPVLTMGALLAVRGGRMPKDELQRALRMVETSSPSYPVMASLDLARAWLDRNGASAWEPALEAVRRLRERLAGLPRFREWDGRTAATKDPLKVALYDAAAALDGFRLKRELEQRGCYPEMADARFVLCAFGAGSRTQDADRLADALEEIDRALAVEGGRSAGGGPKSAYAIGEAFAALPAVSEPVAFSRRPPRSVERVPLEDAVGRTAAEPIVPYPPGVPVVMPGEKITSGAVRALVALRELGCRFVGAVQAGTVACLLPNRISI
ncbi:MAG: hypothetical protein BLM47_03745 [Candidatus Reconcilbacillus cellulovorans]|uniref:Amino acid decarboxylase n=1 Tax=Candidatus Reconcilbacillus cellulovorans TaxID=1906605 RepID=A0A2A6E266_9BACL|nr:MAG: hypothetical protein BLM47_03745 [Candidatus Reconcilbacillus cellulovorans]